MYLNYLHLIWIVPVSAVIGFITAVFCVEASKADQDLETPYGDDEWANREI